VKKTISFGKGIFARFAIFVNLEIETKWEKPKNNKKKVNKTLPIIKIVVVSSIIFLIILYKKYF